MVDFASLNNLNVKQWQDAADEWLSLSKWAMQAAQDIRDQGAGQLKKDWYTGVGEDAHGKLVGMADELEAGADIMRGVTMVLDGLVESMQLAQRTLKTAYDISRDNGIPLDDNGDLPPLKNHIEAEDQHAARSDISNLIAEALRQATDADAKAWPELDKLAAAVNVIKPDDALKLQNEASQTEVALLAGDIPNGKDPALVTAWWNGLTDKQRHDLMLAEPVTLANLDGVPDSVKQELRGTDGKFDRVKLVQWALDNWNKPDETNLGNNCTNFVSEAMMHAGVQQKTDFWWGTKGDDVWMRGNPIGIDLIDKHLAYSSTWGAADNLQNFLTKHGSYEVPASEAKPGDIIFLDQEGPNDDGRPIGKAHHAAIVTAVTPDGDIKYTQHTDSYQNVSLEGRTPGEVKKEGQQDFRIIRIQPDWY